jgi:predicted acetyltransferase
MTARYDIHPVRNKLELQQANDLMAKVFRHDYFDTIEWMRTIGSAYPGFRPEYTRIVRMGEEVAAALRVTSDTIRIGEARLHMGGFGWIATAANHRNKGLASALIGDTLRFMREGSFHVSMLFGIPNFYHRFGFHTTLAEYTTKIDVRDIPPYTGPAFRVRAAKPGDVRQLQRMHEQFDSGTACSLVRCGAHFNYHWQRWEAARVVMGGDGKVLAYFLPTRAKGPARPASSHTKLELDEAGVLNRGVCATLLQAVAAHARDQFLHEVHFHGPPNHPLVEHLHQFRSHHVMELTRGEGGMMAVVNPAETMESMIPEWESQLLAMGERELSSELTTYIDRVPYLVRCHHGAISVLRQPGANKLSLTGEEFIHLLTGYRHLAEVLAARRRILQPSAVLLAQALFPKRTPYVWPADRF